MFYKYQDEIDEFYDKACELHNSTLDLTMKTLFIQPVGHTLEVKTSAGDTFEIAEDETFPNIRFNTPKETVQLKIEEEVRFTNLHFLKVQKDEEGFHALGGLFHSLDNIEEYVRYLVNQGEILELKSEFDTIPDAEEITKIKDIKRL